MVPVDSPIGKEILMYAATQDHCVLEFKHNEDGFQVAEITDHVNELEERVNDAGQE